MNSWLLWGGITLCLFVGFQFGQGSFPRKVERLQNENIYLENLIEELAENSSEAEEALYNLSLYRQSYITDQTDLWASGQEMMDSR